MNALSGVAVVEVGTLGIVKDVGMVVNYRSKSFSKNAANKLPNFRK